MSTMSGGCSAEQQDLPQIPSLPEGKGIAAFWLPEEQNALATALKSFKDFHVTDSKKKKHLKAVLTAFDQTLVMKLSKLGIVHCYADVRPDAAGLSLFKGLLGLGLNPDLPDKDGFRPSHLCSLSGSFGIAEVLLACRPDVHAVDTAGRSPEELVRTMATGLRFKDDALKIAALWEKASKNRFPTIAQLACEKKFWAVQNLVRRGVIPNAEKFRMFREKTVFEWCEVHGEVGLVEELRYLLGEPIERTKDTNANENAQLKELVTVTVSKLTEENEELTEKFGSLQQQVSVKIDDALKKSREKNRMLETEVESLKKSLQAQKTDCDREMEGLKKEVMNSMQAEWKKQREFMQTEWKKQQELMQSQMKTMQDQLTIMPAIVASSVSAAAAVFQSASKKRRFSQD